MQKLILDIGNTSTKCAFYEGDELKVLETQPGFDSQQIFRFLEQHPAKAAIVSSVIDTRNFTGLLQEMVEVLVSLGPDTKLPLENLYHTPHTLGNDRLAAAAGANKLFRDRNVLCIDAGTCIKYDFVNSNNEYVGGSISPGLSMRLKALNAFTGKLPLIELETIDFLTGRDTKESILSGVVNGALAEADGIIQQYSQMYGNLQVVLSGGDAIFFDKKLKNSIFAYPNIVLFGLNEILNRNVYQG